MADVSGEGTNIGGAPTPPPATPPPATPPPGAPRDVSGEGTRIGDAPPPDAPKPDDLDFTTIPQSKLQRAFQIATGQAPTATGGSDMAIDPQAVKDAMKHLSDAYDKLQGKLQGAQMSARAYTKQGGSRLDDIQPPGEEDASRGFVARANPVGAQAYQGLRMMADHIQQTYLAMQQQLTDTVRNDQASADAFRRQGEGL